MPETTLLQIRGSTDSEPTRVVELHGLSVRIGRGPQCEVRLASPELAPVQCLLRRRGPHWHLHPVGPKNYVWLEGSILSSQRPLDSGAEFSVGSFRLTLLPVVTQSGEWDARTPAPAEPERDDPRSRWAKARLEERRWEARWRAVGERVKAEASTPKAPTTSNLSAVPTAIARVSSRPSPAPNKSAQLPATGRTLGAAFAFVPDEFFRTLDRDSFDSELAEIVTTLIDVEVVETLPEQAPAIPVVEVAETSEPISLDAPQSLVEIEDDILLPVTELEPTIATIESPQVLARDLIEVQIPVQARSMPDPPLPDFVKGPPTGVSEPVWNYRTTAEARRSDPHQLERPTGAPRPRSQGEWPSSRSILPREASSITSPKARSIKSEVELTVEVEPSQWKLPRWMVAPFVILATVGITTLGLFLTLQWAIDDLSAGKTYDQLLANVPKSALDTAALELSASVWWRTSAANTHIRAVAIERATEDPTQARPWLQAARSITPVHAASRFTEAKLAADNGEQSSLQTSTGLSRDVISLAWTGRRLAEAGKIEASLAAYRAALDLATRCSLDRLPPPNFLDDDQVRRYQLPYESLITPVIRDMADRPGWTIEQWVTAVPDVAVAKLALARVLGDRKDLEESKALTDALEPSREAVPASSMDDAVHAEALALQRNYTEARSSYRAAIELMTDAAIKRSWWMNIAEIDRRLEDRKSRRDALEAAKSNNPHDEITRRAVDFQELDGRPVVERQTAYTTPRESH